MGTCFPAFVQTPPPPSIMLSISRSAVIGSAMLALASAESLSPPFLQTALEVVSRASSSSEVLSLNLTNLFILLGLKLAIVVFGLFSGIATARSSTGGDTQMDQVDLTGGMCILLYTGGDEEKLDCIARAACESPLSADRFVQAGKMWYKMHSLIQAVPFNEKYNHIMDKVNEATGHGLSGNDCSVYQW